MSYYPEYDKLAKISDQTQAIGEFMDWLADDGVFLARHEENSKYAWPIHRPITDLLAEWAGIDQNKIEAEKRQMLEAIRQSNDA